MSEQIEILKNNILKERRYGCTNFHVTQRPDGTENGNFSYDALDNFVESLGFVDLGDEWKEINQRDALTIAQLVLHKGLAYDGECMTAERALQLAEQFLELFDEARYFTNGIFDDTGLRMWSPISQATFDTGTVCVDDNRIGILWVQDED